jgi:methyl-accepting chemotaxis protein
VVDIGAIPAKPGRFPASDLTENPLMQFLRNLKIGGRLAIGFLLVIALGLAIAGYGRHVLQITSEEVRYVADDLALKVHELNNLKDHAGVIELASRDLVFSDDPQRQAAEAGRLAAAKAEIESLVKELQVTETETEGRARLEQVLAAKAPYLGAIDKAVELASAGQKAEAAAMLMGPVGELHKAYFSALDGMIDLEEKLMHDTAQHVADEAATASWVMVGIALAAALAGTFVAWLATRSITRPMQRAIEAASRVRDGDLSRSIEFQGQDECAQLLGAMHSMQSALTGVVAAVRTNAESVAQASSQIAEANQDLSQRTEEQASALQQAAATMDQLGSSARTNTDSAHQANQLARGASQVALKGGEVVGQVVERMKSINDSSREIAEIIGTIDGIAFQTNILALNAAVEAARAGEQGRGFAVVAGEVRTLAQRSAEAARRIKALINTSVERVEQGTALVDEAGQTMGEIVQSIRRVTDIVGEISSASEEQGTGVQQVATAVNQMDEVTQRNAALVEEGAAAAASLRTQAQSLVQSVAIFRLCAEPADAHALA